MEYLVQYGRPAYLGRFVYSDSHPIARDERVIVHGPRGVEVGLVLAPVRPDLAQSVEAYPSGEIIRPLEASDSPQLQEQAEFLLAFLDEAVPILEDHSLPLEILDAEMLLDGRVIVHVVSWAACDATPLLKAWSQRYKRSFLLLDVTLGIGEPMSPPPSTGCGKPGCGSESGGCTSCGTEKGGCSTGSCSSGKVKSADELTAYFAELRTQMESREGRVPLN